MGMIPSCHIYHSLLLDFINFPVVLALIKLRPNHSTVSDSCTLFIWKFICFIRPSNKSISRRHPLSVIMFMLDWKGMYFIGVRFLCRFFFFFLVVMSFAFDFDGVENEKNQESLSRSQIQGRMRMIEELRKWEDDR